MHFFINVFILLENLSHFFFGLFYESLNRVILIEAGQGIDQAILVQFLDLLIRESYINTHFWIISLRSLQNFHSPLFYYMVKKKRRFTVKLINRRTAKSKGIMMLTSDSEEYSRVGLDRSK